VTVFLVGAGPGDPGLVTVRGLVLIRRCEALVYDVLVSPELVDEAPRDALLVPREKLRQAELNEVLVELGRLGLDVVRLKGGDPFIFGRGGEEALALEAAEVPFEVVPGVSALSAVPASAGIPVTHRGVSAQVTLVSGHSASGDDLDYAQLASAPGTLVVFMGLAQLGRIADGLILAGKDPQTPAAVVSRGTCADSQTVSGQLDVIAELAAGLASPALLVVGDVVAVGNRLAASIRSGAGRAGTSALEPPSSLRLVPAATRAAH
jgi:uroporphyrinogen III methyltransferase / synthase